MAEVTDTTIPYEILIRFDESGALAGAHKVSRRIVSIDGEVVKNDIGPATALVADDAQNPGGLWGVLGEALTIALAKAAEQQNEIAGLKAELAEVLSPGTENAAAK